MSRKTALILSGGGARGAFQCAAEQYAREVKGYQWDIIAGVSVGALNALMLAMKKYDRLRQIWDNISNDQVYTGGFNLWSGIKVLLGARSFYGNDPLRQLLLKEYEPNRIQVDVRIGATSLVSGEYTRFTPNMPNFVEAVLASTVMPIIWSPVDVSAFYRSMVDGGVRNISPLGDVLGDAPDEIVIINCGNSNMEPKPAPRNILEIAIHTLDILENEVFRTDLREFLHLNALVDEAARSGVILHHPDTGAELKSYACTIIEPTISLPDVLDFSRESVQKSLRHGLERAQAVFG